MLNYKKILIIFFSAIFLAFALFSFSFAQRKLEVPIPGLKTTTLPALPDYIVAIFNFSLMIIGIIVFGALIYGGFRYLTSAGSPTAMADAKDQIFSALLGLIILLCSYLILTTINPELVILGEPGKGAIGPMPGAYPFVMRLYKDADYQGEECDIGRTDKNIEDLCGAGWNDTISSIKFEDPKYVAVIHEDVDFTGKAQLIEIDVPKLDAHMNDKTSSITVIRKAGSSKKATLYGDAGYKSDQMHLYSKDFSAAHSNFTDIVYDNDNFNDKASSITVERGVIAIIYEHPDYKGAARIIIKDDSTFDPRNDAPLCTGFWNDEDHCPGCGTSGCCGWLDDCWNDKVSSIQIVNGYIVTTLPSRCAGFPDTTCVAEGCEWCPKCSANFEENSWGFDACLEPGTCTRTCSANCDGEMCPKCSGFDEADPSQADKCVSTGTCAHPITCSAACNGEMCLKCGGSGGLFENPFDTDTCVTTGTCTHPDCSAACGGEWCLRCSGWWENPWGADTCVATGTCNYPTCSAACGCFVTAYENADYGGNSLVVTGDIPDLTAIGWNDKITSMKVPPGATVVIWSDINYGGTSRTITADDNNFDTCAAEDICSGCGTGGCFLWLCECWNDKISSIDIQ